MHLLCPHCKYPIELVKLDPCAKITCTSCGSRFRIDEGSTTGWIDHSITPIRRFSIIETVGHGAFGSVFKARDPDGFYNLLGKPAVTNSAVLAAHLRQTLSVMRDGGQKCKETQALTLLALHDHR